MMAKNERPNFQLVTAEDTVCLDRSIEYLKDQDFLKKRKPDKYNGNLHKIVTFYSIMYCNICVV